MIDELHAAWAELTAPGAPYAMTDTTVRGIPMRVFTAAPPNVRLLWELASGYGDRTYLVYEDERYTFAEIAGQVRSLAHLLRNEHGVGSGDRVAIAMRNYPEWVVSYWAIISVGAAAVGMNAWWTTPEMEYGLTDSRPKVLIADDERLARIEPVLDGVRAAAPLSIISVRTDRPLPSDAVRWSDVVSSATAPATLPDATIDPDDDACIFYTSGTTGFPKGAQLTHRGCIHNLMHLGFWGAASRLAQEAVKPGSTVAPETAPPAVIMAPTPLFHVTANNCLLYPATAGGGTLVLTYKWDPARALELIEREHVTNFSGVPTMSRELIAHPDWATRDTSSLQGMGGGGAALQPDLVEKIDKTLAGGKPSTGYGLTETHGIVTANGAEFFLLKPASCGPIMPTFESKLVDETGDEVPAGEPGQLCVRGPAVIKGYINRPEESEKSLKDGWFNTGDVARIDEDGFVYIVDRVKDMVLRGGENVYCSEVETAIYEHPSVAEAAVFGVPDERLGEEVGAAVVLAAGASLTEAELQAFLTGKLAKHKIPAKVWIREVPLPRNANGKFVKRDLKKELLEP